VLQFAPALPKTRSGKIMRRILHKIAENDTQWREPLLPHVNRLNLCWRNLPTQD
jgi:hypothetical protein